MAIEVDDDDEVPTQGKRMRNTHSKELYVQFTDEDVDKVDDTEGRRYVNCIACVEHRFLVLIIHVYTSAS
jgi:hypothetical protein